MRRRSSWSAASLGLALAIATAAAPPAGAATLVERAVEVDIRPDGLVREKTRLTVRLDTPADVAAWSTVPVPLNENRKLLHLTAGATDPSGKHHGVGRKGLDTLELAGEGELHSSARYRTVTFPAVPPGSVLSLRYEVEERPYFPSGALSLGGIEAAERVSVAVRGGGSGFRFRLDGPTEGFTVIPEAGGVRIEATGRPPRPAPEAAAADAAYQPVLRYAWGEGGDWAAVGRWWQGLVASLPPPPEAVRAKARELVAGIDGRRARLAALLKFASRDVRYVAVEVGIGGYRPAPPGEVLDRRWGDCKDKAVLLVALLAEAGIEAWPALILSAADDRIDSAFPTPTQFNHVIVAVRADGVAAADDPVAGGYLFVDPTPTQGTLHWLHPGVQDQDALVVTDGGGQLVRTPLRPELEVYDLTVDLTLSPDGTARGQARLAVSGDFAATLADFFARSRPDEADRAVRGAFASLLPGAQLADLKWRALQGDLPHANLDARVELPAFGTTAFVLPQGGSFPKTSLLDGRTLPILLHPASAGVTWRITLPDGTCPPQVEPTVVDNEVGSYRQTVTAEGRRLTVERRTRVKQRWAEPQAFPGLKELTLAETRSGKRRIRIDCGEGIR